MGGTRPPGGASGEPTDWHPLQEELVKKGKLGFSYIPPDKGTMPGASEIANVAKEEISQEVQKKSLPSVQHKMDKTPKETRAVQTSWMSRILGKKSLTYTLDPSQFFNLKESDSAPSLADQWKKQETQGFSGNHPESFKLDLPRSRRNVTISAQGKKPIVKEFIREKDIKKGGEALGEMLATTSLPKDRQEKVRYQLEDILTQRIHAPGYTAFALSKMESGLVPQEHKDHPGNTYDVHTEGNIVVVKATCFYKVCDPTDNFAIRGYDAIRTEVRIDLSKMGDDGFNDPEQVKKFVRMSYTIHGTEQDERKVRFSG